SAIGRGLVIDLDGIASQKDGPERTALRWSFTGKRAHHLLGSAARRECPNLPAADVEILEVQSKASGFCRGHTQRPGAAALRIGKPATLAQEFRRQLARNAHPGVMGRAR